ncbi:hypothetical protein [Cupriavidus nantongensis]
MKTLITVAGPIGRLTLAQYSRVDSVAHFVVNTAPHDPAGGR